MRLKCYADPRILCVPQPSRLQATISVRPADFGQPTSRAPMAHRLGLAATVFIVLLGTFLADRPFFSPESSQRISRLHLLELRSCCLLLIGSSDSDWLPSCASALPNHLPDRLFGPARGAVFRAGNPAWHSQLAACSHADCYLRARGCRRCNIWPNPANWADLAVLLLVGLVD